MNSFPEGLSPQAALIKRAFDVVASALGLIGLWWLIVICFLAASIDTRANGLFVQERVGLKGKLFRVFKIRTMRVTTNDENTVTTADDARITRLGGIFRRYKLDELPQLINVLMGEMSFVGPRPDVPGYADRLEGDDRVLLSIRPGITGPATLQFRDEEQILAAQDDPQEYNSRVIYPEKIRINRAYIENYSFYNDLKIIWKTVFK